MKTYVFDASALFVFLQKKPGAHKVSALLKEAMRGRAAIFMSAVNYGEVYGGVLREHGPERARATMSACVPCSRLRRCQPGRGVARLLEGIEVKICKLILPRAALLRRWPWNIKARW